MCGIIGVYKRNEEAVLDVYDGLLMLQHRGQDAAGIVTLENKTFHEKRGAGMVSEVFQQHDMLRLRGSIGLGHCRYPTAGSLDPSEAQPFFINSPLGIYMIHNGNLTNTEALRNTIENKHYRHLRTSSDTEMLLNIFGHKLYKTMKDKNECHACLSECVFDAVTETMTDISGAYSVVSIIDQVGMCVFRDPHGIRPLIMGKKETTKGTEYMFASESISLSSQGYEIVRDVLPGEAIIVTLDGTLISHQCIKGELNPCIFEFVYLARPESIIDGISVYKSRLRMGTHLAKQVKDSGLVDEIDVVMPVPDSGRPMAIQLAEEIGKIYREGLMKNRYVGRTFIMPGQAARKKSIRRKLAPVELEFKGKNILLVDDSIVRGNTMKQIIAMCRQAGAKKIFVASGAPAVINPDVYGIDMPTRTELVAHGLTTEEICTVIGADHLFYQKTEDLIAACKAGNKTIDKFHTGVFDGGYPTAEVTEEFLQNVEFQGRGKQAKIQEQVSSLTL